MRENPAPLANRNPDRRLPRPAVRSAGPCVCGCLASQEIEQHAGDVLDLVVFGVGVVIVNVLNLHMFLDSENMTSAITVTVLWFVFSTVRSSFAGLFAAK